MLDSLLISIRKRNQVMLTRGPPGGVKLLLKIARCTEMYEAEIFVMITYLYLDQSITDCKTRWVIHARMEGVGA